MKKTIAIQWMAAAALVIATCALSHAQELKVPGLQEPVEVIRDNYGVNHIYAKNEHDLFFAQGYCAAKDRLFQFEMWRRQATGTVAEILGTKETNRDIGARLFKFRGALNAELNHYHPRGEAIIGAFTEGINACVKESLTHKEKLPLEFKLLNITPGLWTPEVVISRHQGLLGNIGEEVLVGRQVATVGSAMARQLEVFEPGEPILDLVAPIKGERLFDNVIGLYEAFRKPIAFTPGDLVVSANSNQKQYATLALMDARDYEDAWGGNRQIIGSNNWIVSGEHTQSGYPMLANDPHRALAAPSLRYMVHLNAPGWNVVGGGEPTIPGVSIGHNEHGAWGLTIFSIDGEDLMVYNLNPKNTNQYLYMGNWEDFKVIADTIIVKGAPPVVVEHRYTRHGPVTFHDPKNNLAYAMRCAWMEPGGAPYLASLRMDQATNWDEFREACSYNHLPGENMIWMDRSGDIGWQAAGIAPQRKNFSGLVPVPGDGRFEWAGFLPIRSLPNVHNPAKGFWATANENLVPRGYAHNDAIGLNWADTYRADRVNEVLGGSRKHTMNDMMRLQFDYLSIPARQLVPFLSQLKSQDPSTEIARQRLMSWDFILDKNSIAAGIYVAWEKKLGENAVKTFVPQNARPLYKSIPLSRLIEWISTAHPSFGAKPIEARNAFLLISLQQAVADLTTKLGPDMKKWQYGQNTYHHVLIKHTLSNAVNAETRKKLDVGPLPRAGYGSTPGMTGNGDNQTSGASFRMVADAKDWDLTMFTNTPGQSGDSSSPFYRNLFDYWANDQHFPVYFSREKVEKSAAEKVVLKP
jgi:penicillin amidase